MKSILTVATGCLFIASGATIACPLMDAKQKTTKFGQQDQTQQTLVENKVEKIDPELLAKLLLQKKDKDVN